MLSYCWNCRKKAESKKQKVQKIKDGWIMLSSNCAICGSKKSNYIKEQETRGLFKFIRIKVPILSVSIANILF